MNLESVPDIPTRLKTGLKSGLQTSLKLFKFVLPIYVAVDLLNGRDRLRLHRRIPAQPVRSHRYPGASASYGLAGHPVRADDGDFS
ncbi:MAG: hypothetical protein P8Z70_04955 [Desulfuromonadales bacterium]